MKRNRPSLVCLALVFCLSASAIDRNRRMDQLYHTSWTLKDGAPSEIFAMAQTVDGYLWLGTTSGLVRFDGVRFADFEPQSGQALPERNVSALLATPDGGLWIGHAPGGVSFLKRGAITSYGARNGMPSGAVRAIVRDTESLIWVAALGGLARLEGSQWKSIGADWNFSGSATAALVDRHGNLWIGTTTSVFFLAKGTRRFQKVADRLEYVTRLGESSDGTMWMAELGQSVRPVPLPGSGASLQSGPQVRVGSIAMLFDDQGSLWITSIGDGVRRMQNPEWSPGQGVEHVVPEDAFTHKQGLSSDYVESIFEDSEGDIWIGTNAGLDRFRQSTVVPIAYPGKGGYMSLMAADQGVVWAGVISNRIWLIQDRRFSANLPAELESLRSVGSNCIYRDPRGVIWLATTERLLRFSSGRLDRIDYPPGPAPTPTDRLGTAITMTGEKSGMLWASILGNGVFRLDDRLWTSIESLGGPKGVAISSFTDSDGRVWFGYTDKTVVLVNRDKIQVLSAKDVPIGKVRCIHGRSSKVWIGGDAGVAMFDGSRFRPLLPSSEGRFQDVFGIVETANDGLWFSDHSGIIHVPESEVRLFEKEPDRKVSFQLFSLLDGLPVPLQKSSVVPSVVEASDGILWFTTSQGVVWVDPNRIAKDTVPPPVSLEAVVADGKKYDPSAAFTLPAHTANLNIVYTGVGLSMPERIRFRYKLEGSDHDWQDAGSRREAFYTNPGPGAFRFRVIACNQDGVWNQAGAVMNFSITPAYYQTVWFEILCAMALAGLLWLIYLLRMKQVTAQVQARLGERLVERERIARELHDTLLQGFNGLVLRFQAVMKQIPPDAPARQMMESALDRADDVLLEGRLRVRDLRSDAATGSELAESLAKCGEELSEEGAEGFSLAIIGAPRLLDPIALDEVYRIGREALVNAFQHSKASKIEVEITYHPARFRLRVRDDGCGIDSNVLESGRPGHWGLSGIRERAQNIGGQLSIWSHKGAGTELELLIPGKVVYRRSDKPSRWSRLKRGMLGGGSDHARPKED